MRVTPSMALVWLRWYLEKLDSRGRSSLAGDPSASGSSNDHAPMSRKALLIAILLGQCPVSSLYVTGSRPVRVSRGPLRVGVSLGSLELVDAHEPILARRTVLQEWARLWAVEAELHSERLTTRSGERLDELEVLARKATERREAIERSNSFSRGLEWLADELTHRASVAGELRSWAEFEGAA